MYEYYTLHIASQTVSNNPTFFISIVRTIDLCIQSVASADVSTKHTVKGIGW